MFEQIANSIFFRTSSSFDSNIGYISSGDRRALVDTGTGMHSDSVQRDLNRLGVSIEDITDILLTHSHIDHIGGVVGILKETNPTIHLHKSEAERINAGDMELTLSSHFGVKLPPMKIDNLLEEGDTVNLGDVTLEVLHTPGHSIGSICLFEKSQSLMFTGDTMFAGASFGRVDFPTGSPERLVASLKRLSEIDFEIALAGHMHPIKHNASRSAQSSYRSAKMMFRI
ncbi:MBL fold metallo-hydrolase [Candidatus Thorarchaeota archaeon]|nr:MAG: MBL fold metallo-hydrolase [Candidatus Thorarchaeota archaeon]